MSVFGFTKQTLTQPKQILFRFEPEFCLFVLRTPYLQAASKIKLGLDENVEATFKMSQSLYLNRPKAPCTEKANYSLTACLLDYVEQKAG